jgi:hypothetical protein
MKIYIETREECNATTILGNMFEVGHSPCMLKTSFEDIEKEKEQCNHHTRLNHLPLPTSPYFSSGSQSCCPSSRRRRKK